MTTTVTDQNVIAVKLGTHPERVMVMGGHYDSRTVDPVSATDRAPGANDSGSQTALVLEAARVMAGHTFDATLILPRSPRKNKDSPGSAQLAKDYANYVTAGAKVEAMLNCDIVGGDTAPTTPRSLRQFRLFSSGTPREIVTPMGKTDDTSPSRGIMRYIGYWGSLYVPSMAMLPQLREDRPSRGGDQQSFLDQAIPAVRFIETVESPNAGTAGSHQHTPDDLPMYVTPGLHGTHHAARGGNGSQPGARSDGASIGDGVGKRQRPVDRRLDGARFRYRRRPLRDRGTPIDGELLPHAGRRPGQHDVARGDRCRARSSGSGIFYISVAAVDAAGHESLFAYPEYRCDTSSCVVPSDALNVTARN